MHGDLHHENIICASRDPWLAIDPKGLMGDPPFNAGSMLIHLKPKQKIENPKLITHISGLIDSAINPYNILI